MAAKHYTAYRIACVATGLSYIGMTCMSLKDRWQKHTSEARIGRDRKLYRAMREHGIDSFDMVAIACVLRPSDCWDVERERIAQWGTFASGYNELPGVPQGAGDPGVPDFFTGPNRRPVPEWQKAHMRALFTGRVDSQDTRERKRKAQQARAREIGDRFRGRTLSEAICSARSRARGGHGAIVYDGATYPSLRLAAAAAGVSKATMRAWVKRHGPVLPRMVKGVGRCPARAA